MKTLLSATIGFAIFTAVGVAAADDAATIKVFKAQCATCHGVDGKGQTTPGKQFNMKSWGDGKTLNKLTDAEIDKQIRVGSLGDDGKERMPAFAKLGDDQIKALIAYVRTFQK
jgi:mono/diheme cytochrome c family protein